MTDAPRTVAEALDFAQAESRDETQDWTNYCQRFVRSCYGIPSLFGSAWAQWLGADPEDKHPGGAIEDAPVGAALCFKGGTYGHIILAAHPGVASTSGGEAGARAWSNDLVRRGDIDIVLRDDPIIHWGQEYVGWLSAVNDYDLQLAHRKPPKPKQATPYGRIGVAIDRLEGALETAVRLEDRKDAKVIRAEVRHLKEIHAALRHA